MLRCGHAYFLVLFRRVLPSPLRSTPEPRSDHAIALFWLNSRVHLVFFRLDSFGGGAMVVVVAVVVAKRQGVCWLLTLPYQPHMVPPDRVKSHFRIHEITFAGFNQTWLFKWSGVLCASVLTLVFSALVCTHSSINKKSSLERWNFTKFRRWSKMRSSISTAYKSDACRSPLTCNNKSVCYLDPHLTPWPVWAGQKKRLAGRRAISRNNLPRRIKLTDAATHEQAEICTNFNCF